jgi:hypothetical protein
VLFIIFAAAKQIMMINKLTSIKFTAFLFNYSIKTAFSLPIIFIANPFLRHL